MSEINDAASDIAADLPDESDVTVSDLEEELEQLVNQFSTPLNEAKRIVRRNNDAAPEETGPTGDEDGNPIEMGVEEFDTDGQLVTVEVKVLQQWEPRHDSIQQVGLVGDGSGTNKFTAFKGNDWPILEEGESYRIEGAVSDQYQGDFSLKFIDTTTVEQLDTEVEVDDNSIEITAPVVTVNEYTSGFIERCSEEDCTRVLNDGRCAEHGKVDGEDDLRMKVTVDTGTRFYVLFFDKEHVEEHTGITIDDARDMAQEAMNRGVVLNELLPQYVSQYWNVEGRDIGENNDGITRIKVNTATTEFDDVDFESEASDLIARANEVSA